MKCPSCKGKRVARLIGGACSWCGGAGDVTVKTALRYADVSEALGRGGYIAGDHDLAICREMEAEAKAIRASVRR